MAWVIALEDTDVVVDLSEVQFMSAATVGVLIRARELLQARSRTFIVRSPSQSAQRILQLCDATDLLDPVEATALTGAGGVIATWVPVPATDHVDRHAVAAAPEPARAPTSLSVGQPTTATLSSANVEDRAHEHASDVASVGAP